MLTTEDLLAKFLDQQEMSPYELGRVIDQLEEWLAQAKVLYNRGRLGLGRVKLARDDMSRTHEDIILDFIRECCITGDRLSVINRTLYPAFLDWCGKRGELHIIGSYFYRFLTDHGFGVYNLHGVRYRRGIALKP